MPEQSKVKAVSPAAVWLLGAAFTAVTIAGCIRWVDRPLAEFLDRQPGHAHLASIINKALLPFSAMVVVAFVFLLACGLLRMNGRVPGAAIRLPLLCTWATTAALAAEAILKPIFGRGWPDPTYLRNHLYGFHILHSSQHWTSFPSGVALVSGSVASVVWKEARGLRPLAVALPALLWLAVLISNDHWLSDVLAGAYLGMSLGWITVSLLSSPPVDAHSLV